MPSASFPLGAPRATSSTNKQAGVAFRTPCKGLKRAVFAPLFIYIFFVESLFGTQPPSPNFTHLVGRMAGLLFSYEEEPFHQRLFFLRISRRREAFGLYFRTDRLATAFLIVTLRLPPHLVRKERESLVKAVPVVQYPPNGSLVFQKFL